MLVHIFTGPLARKYDFFWSFNEAKSNLPSRTILYLFLTSCHTVSSLDNSFVAGLSFLGLKIHHSALLQPRIVHIDQILIWMCKVSTLHSASSSRVWAALYCLRHEMYGPKPAKKITAALTVFHDPQWWEAPLFLPIYSSPLDIYFL